jgi:uncharacterized protein YbaA (DUF1428 family)
MYIDAFLIPVKTAEKDRYAEIAHGVSRIMVAHGAARVTEYWGDETPEGEVTSFPRALQLKPDETVVLTVNAFPDKATRDAAMAAMRDNAELGALLADAPADGPRIIFGGFDMLTDVSA